MLVVKTGRGLVEGERIERCNLDAANAFRLHLFQFTLQLGLGDTGTKPPPAHHDAAIVGGTGERFLEIGDVVVLSSTNGWLNDRPKYSGKQKKDNLVFDDGHVRISKIKRRQRAAPT